MSDRRGGDEVVLRSEAPVTLIGGGPWRAEDLAAALAIAPTLVAADSGADAALSAGVEPALVVGDMDSISPDARARLGGRVHADRGAGFDGLRQGPALDRCAADAGGRVRRGAAGP